MLTALQETIARLVAGLPEAERFALAGGAALIVHGVVDRRTDDLDFFSTSPDHIARLHTALEAALTQAGLSVHTEQATPSFVRLVVDDGNDSTVVDLAWDVRLRPAVHSPIGPLISEEELAADKTLALFGRAEARDFVDVHRLARRYGIDQLCALAHEKDAGFSRARLAESLGQFRRFDRVDFDVDDATYTALRAWVSGLRRSLERSVERREPPGRKL